MPKQHYGKKPKKEIVEKKKHNDVTKKPKKKTEHKKPSKKTSNNKKLLLITGAAAALFIIVASVILSSIYTIKTLKAKVDLYAETQAFADAQDEINKILSKYGFTSSTIDHEEMNSTDVFNLYALSYSLTVETNIISEKNRRENEQHYDASYGAGVETSIPINIASDLYADVLYETSEHGYTITINGTKFESGYIEKPDEAFYTADYNSETHNKVIICQDLVSDALDDEKVYLYYYDGEKAFYCGSIDIGVNRLLISNAGYFTAPSGISALLNDTWLYCEVYRLDDENGYAVNKDEIEEGSDGFYDFYYTHNVFARDKFQGYYSPDAESEKFDFYAMETLKLTGISKNGFIKAETDDGYTGYIYVQDFDKIEIDGVLTPAKDLLFGLDYKD